MRTFLLLAFVGLLSLLAWRLGFQREAASPSSQDLAKEVKLREPANEVAPTPAGIERDSNPAAGSSPAPSLAGSRKPVSAAALAALLAKYSSGQEWKVDLDESGLPLRMTGAGLKAIFENGGEGESFLREYTELLGFSELPPLAREDSTTSRFQIVDYVQRHTLATGETLPVFESWLRFKGSPDEGAFIGNNQLRPVENLRGDLGLSDEEALSIVRRAFNGPAQKIEVKSSKVVYAHERPHQLATQITITGPLPHWLVLVGHESKTILYRTIVSRR